MIYKNILIILSFALAVGCSSEKQNSAEDAIQEDEYKKLSRAIWDYSFEKSGSRARHVSYLPGFNNMNRSLARIAKLWA